MYMTIYEEHSLQVLFFICIISIYDIGLKYTKYLKYLIVLKLELKHTNKTYITNYAIITRKNILIVL